MNKAYAVALAVPSIGVSLFSIKTLVCTMKLTPDGLMTDTVQTFCWITGYGL
jgi:hypothetical protein